MGEHSLIFLDFFFENDNLTLIVNGIGDIKNDKVIVVSQKKIFSYKLEDF